MKQIVFIGLFVLVGCVTTPDTIIKGTDILGEMVVVLEEDFYNVIDGYAAREKLLYHKQLDAQYMDIMERIVSEEGSVQLEDHTAVLTNYADRMEEIDGWVDTDTMNLKVKVATAFAQVKLLIAKLNEYNKAEGVPPESLAALKQASFEILDGMKEMAAIEATQEAGAFRDKLQGMLDKFNTVRDIAGQLDIPGAL